MRATMRLYLIRHAQSANNAVFDGTDHYPNRTADPEITDIGHRQAQHLAEFLGRPDSEPRQYPYRVTTEHTFGLTHLYCSLMIRSILTAQYVAQACELKLQALPDIFEKGGLFETAHNGELVGISGPGRAYFQDRFEGLELPLELGEDGWWNRPKETEEDFFQRTTQALGNVFDRHADTDDRVGMVVHGDFIDQSINELMGVNRKPETSGSDWAANWVFHNTSVSRIDVAGGARNVVYLNRIDHLSPDCITW